MQIKELVYNNDQKISSMMKLVRFLVIKWTVVVILQTMFFVILPYSRFTSEYYLTYVTCGTSVLILNEINILITIHIFDNK